MRSIAEHFQFVQSLADRPSAGASPIETLPIQDATGRILASPAVAALAVPPFSNSAMDGFAIRRSDIPADVESADAESNGPWVFPISGDIAAGFTPELPPKGHAQRIMTGAPVPEDADLLIIPVEDTNIPIGPHPLPAEIEVSRIKVDRDHIRRAGNNIQQGDVVAPAGTVLDAGAIAALLSTGVTTVEVVGVRRVGVITTGDEVIDLADGTALQEGQIPDSNGPMVAALAGVGQPGLDVQQYRVKDTPEEFEATLDRLADEVDLIITTGGVSAGAFDVVRAVASRGNDEDGDDAAGRAGDAAGHTDVGEAEREGDEGERAGESAMWFGPIAMKPGKPQGAGKWRGTPMLCLPGNPVSAWVSFQLFGATLLRALRGLPTTESVWARPQVTATVRGQLPTTSGRPLVVPVRVTYGSGGPELRGFSGSSFGSHFVGSLVGVNGMVVIDADALAKTDGEVLSVILTDGN